MLGSMILRGTGGVPIRVMFTAQMSRAPGPLWRRGSLTRVNVVSFLHAGKHGNSQRHLNMCFCVVLSSKNRGKFGNLEPKKGRVSNAPQAVHLLAHTVCEDARFTTQQVVFVYPAFVTKSPSLGAIATLRDCWCDERIGASRSMKASSRGDKRSAHISSSRVLVSQGNGIVNCSSSKKSDIFRPF